MHFRKHKNTTEIVFSKKERKLIYEKGKVIIDYRDGRHFVNQLAMVVADIHLHYKDNDPDIEKTLSYGDEKVRLK
jgi:dimeric dUTPase (all-alpha-NTP-PPase superfamily)|tara:strand:+ start:2371 stop:2595 length:225 start_codon:yes stop_codon:yes gene_type:complete